MTANKFYVPAFVGGKIKAVQIAIQNPTGSDITTSYQNGIYYSFEGNDYQLLSCAAATIEAGKTVQLTTQLYDAPVPTSDIKLMIDTSGLTDCIINAMVLWEVDGDD